MANPWEPEYIITPERALEIIVNQFPDLQAHKIEFMGAGNDNTAYLLNDEYVFRFPRKTESVLYLRDELFVLSKIAKFLPAPIPVPQWIGRPETDFPWIFAGYRKLAGQTACHLNLGDRERTALAQPLAHFLSKLHTILISTEHLKALTDDTLIKLDPKLLVYKAKNNLEQMGLRGLLENKNQLHTILDALANLSFPEDRCIVHGDLYVRHILIDARHQFGGVIDWGDVHIGNAAIDISIAHSFLPPSAHQEFKDAYGTISDNTWLLAKLRALYLGTVMVVRGYSVNDPVQVREGRRALRYISQI